MIGIGVKRNRAMAHPVRNVSFAAAGGALLLSGWLSIGSEGDTAATSESLAQKTTRFSAQHMAGFANFTNGRDVFDECKLDRSISLGQLSRHLLNQGICDACHGADMGASDDVQAHRNQHTWMGVGAVSGKLKMQRRRMVPAVRGVAPQSMPYQKRVLDDLNLAKNSHGEDLVPIAQRAVPSTHQSPAIAQTDDVRTLHTAGAQTTRLEQLLAVSTELNVDDNAENEMVSPRLPPQQSVHAAMARVAPFVEKCKTTDSGRMVVQLVVAGGTGRVVSSEVVDTRFKGTSTARCAIRAVQNIKLPVFQKDRLIIKYPFVL